MNINMFERKKLQKKFKYVKSTFQITKTMKIYFKYLCKYFEKT